MRTAKHWARAHVTIDGVEDSGGGVVGLGWSDTSVEDAHRVAIKRARRAAATLKADAPLTASDYPYPDRPIREPVIDEIRAGDRITAVITRNSYGALILNTADVMFIDIDAPIGMFGKLRSILTGGGGAGDLAHKTASRLNEIAGADTRLGFRLYSTAAGLRVLVTGRTFDPASAEAEDLMNRLDADKQYVQLCRMQACFRARLTPKPWRCAVPRPPGVFPYEEGRQREVFEAWLKQYEQTSNAYAVCELIARIGQTAVTENVRPILTWHDELACGESLPLA